MNSYRSMTRRGLYRSRNGVILGVCRGLADYFDFSVLWIRAIAVILFIFTDFWPAIGLYILAALLMKSEPGRYAHARTTNKANGRHSCTKQDTRERLKRKWQHLDRRIRRMEDKVTSHEFDWNNRFGG